MACGSLNFEFCKYIFLYPKHLVFELEAENALTLRESLSVVIDPKYNYTIVTVRIETQD